MRESPAAVAAYAAYLAQPQGKRSLRRLAEELGRSPAYARQLERWSTAHGWQARVAAHDAKVIASAQETRDKSRQLALAELQRGAIVAARYMVQLIEDQRVLPIMDRQGQPVTVPVLGPDGRQLHDADGKPISEPALRPMVRASTKVEAAKHLLGCLGVDRVQRLAMESLQAAPVDAAAAVVGRLDAAALSALRKEIAAQRERQALAGEQDPPESDGA